MGKHGMHPLRVAFLHVTPQSFIGGYEAFAAELARNLREVGVIPDQVDVATGLSRLAYLLTAGTAAHVPQISKPERANLMQARARIERADCVYVKNDLLDLFVARVVAYDKAVVVGIHSSLDIPSIDWRTGIRRAIRRSFVYRRLLMGQRHFYHCLYPPPAAWRLPGSRVRVVPNTVERGLPLSRPARKLQRFLFVGRLNRDKGADLLSSLADRLSTQPETELVVVGDGEYSEAIRKHVAVTHYPFRSDIRNLMRSASWLLLPSRWEQQPRVLLEAMAEGLPYIIGPASEIQTFALDTKLVMGQATVDALYKCCLSAIEMGRIPSEYGRMTSKVAELATRWPGHAETLKQMVQLLRDSAELQSVEN